MMSGILDGSVLIENADPIAVLNSVAGLGFDSCVFANLLAIDKNLSPRKLAVTAREAERLGLTLRGGINWLHPNRPDRCADYAALANGDFQRGLELAVGRAADCGIDRLFFSIGTLEDRASKAEPWQSQLEAVAQLISAMAPTLRAANMRLLVKTHEELSSDDALWLVEATDHQILGVALDPANLIIRREDPLDAARKLSAIVDQLHVDDAAIERNGDRLIRHLAPLGRGFIDWNGLFAEIPHARPFIELHRGQFDISPSDTGERDVFDDFVDARIREIDWNPLDLEGRLAVAAQQLAAPPEKRADQ
ncbi:TIM barrel protein [Devosia sp. YIM 151766]|uniref:sugar phosphate isomerase/epimerase family protein n=1 Tax=Devosia sp. YIM 151766 TaxID=3017325 RepID=UPI00255CAC46|nr:TIM barrel protein [Devosia sp. YIM 151766]WIY53874.1 TIM barrel protein [Devosia sp. YIM 151766]